MARENLAEMAEILGAYQTEGRRGDGSCTSDTLVLPSLGRETHANCSDCGLGGSDDALQVKMENIFPPRRRQRLPLESLHSIVMRTPTIQMYFFSHDVKGHETRCARKLGPFEQTAKSIRNHRFYNLISIDTNLLKIRESLVAFLIVLLQHLSNIHGVSLVV